MKFKKFLSALMAFCTVFGTMTGLFSITAFAAEEDAVVAEDKDNGSSSGPIDYLTKVYGSAEEKLADMKLKLTRYGYELYCEENTGEIAIKNLATGDVMFSNPIDAAGDNTSEAVKAEMLSQIIISYTQNNIPGSMSSFTEAAQRGQIKVKNVKNGVRVEYTLGRSESRHLVPRIIEKSRFESLIYDKVTDETDRAKIDAYYELKDPSTLPESAKLALYQALPITKKMAVYVFATDATERQIESIEQIILTYCPDYTYETMEEDHALTEYEGTDAAPINFKLSLEYYIEKDGLAVRLPANGIRFDETSCVLENIKVLPYMGAAGSKFTGYTVIPDGSGALVSFEDVAAAGSARKISGAMYGADFAYHEISLSRQEVMRFPIFGLVENVETKAEDGTKTVRSRGYLAIIEEGDALSTIVSDHGGGATGIHNYNSVYIQVTPRPKDSYSLASASATGSTAKWSIVSERKYTGSYRLKYIMLTDKDYADEVESDTQTYDASYVGMAHAYRNYLIEKGTLKPLDHTRDNIPLYIETLGALDTEKKILSFPVTVKQELTTFDNIKTMTDELKQSGVSDIIYKLTGFANGGLDSSVPTKVKFEKVVGGNKGFADLLSYAEQNNISLYPEFDLSYCKKGKTGGWFSGFSLRKDAVKTIDGRYTRKFEVTINDYFQLVGIAISPASFEKLFDKLFASMGKIGELKGISLSTLGTDLNSDFDESDPANREDSKETVMKLLSKVKESCGSIMISGGNAYAAGYVDHILDMSLDSSKFTYSSRAIPLVSMVLHGYVSYAGSPTNTAGDVRYEKLKLIENGANPYFVLAYDNVSYLKSSEYFKYYSVSYSIWHDDIISIYKEMNDALSGVMYDTIENHEFLRGERIPTDEELASLDDPEGEIPVIKVSDDGYEYTKFTSDDGTIVKVTYSNGTSFILNYNIFTVEAQGHTIPGLGYVKIA